jgi:serpin B
MTARTCAVLALSAICSAAPAGEPAADQLAQKKVVAGLNAFGVDLYKQLATPGGGNLFCSPASIHTALAMTYGGAAGKTAGQMADVLHYPYGPAELPRPYGRLIARLNDVPEYTTHVREGGAVKRIRRKAYQLNVANGLWVQEGLVLRDAFVALNRRHYKAGLFLLDFADEPAARKSKDRKA